MMCLESQDLFNRELALTFVFVVIPPAGSAWDYKHVSPSAIVTLLPHFGTITPCIIAGITLFIYNLPHQIMR
jgi:hypothetical protein